MGEVKFTRANKESEGQIEMGLWILEVCNGLGERSDTLPLSVKETN